MDRNNNPQTVTLATEMYEELVRMADSSERYTTRRIRRHARKFNPHLQPAHQQKVLEHEAFRSQGIYDARQVLAKAAGKVVFARTNVNYSSKPLEDDVFTPVIVKRINKANRRLLDAYKTDATKFGYYNKSVVSPDCIHLELPEDYIQISDCPWVSGYRGLWVKVGSPIYWYSIECEARKEDHDRTEAKQELTEKANPDHKRFDQAVDTVHYHDVIGDR